MNVALALRLLWHNNTLLWHEHWSRERIKTYQASRLRELRRFALAHSPFYRTFHKQLESRPLSEPPVLTKRHLMEAYDDAVTDRAIRLADVRNHISSGLAGKLFLGRYQVCATSGTSGEPGIFLYASREWAWILASFARANRWAGIPAGLFHQLRLAMVGSSKPWPLSNAVAESLHSPWVPSLRLAATDPVADICRKLTGWRPRLLITYAAMAGILAEEELASRLDIAPQVVMCVAEALTRAVRTQVRRAWGAEPFKIYSSRETACIAAECHAHAGLHLFEDLLVTEVVDEDNHPVPLGTMGAKVLVSLLFSRTLPLIRYELDDGANLSSDDCDCRLPFRRLTKIGGRIAETLRIARPDGSVANLHPTQFEGVIGLTDVKCWQVIRERDGLRVMLLAPVSEVTRHKVAANLRALLETLDIHDLPVNLEIVGDIHRTPPGKMVLVYDASSE
jgi:phenylacetate-coenzyme A ligase PaaK-like adenylate-forming protein